ncbi:MAG: thioredoxin domain-containing protein [Nanoarchaeota archaeon]
MKGNKIKWFSVVGIGLILFLMIGYFIPISKTSGGNEIVVDKLLGVMILHNPFVLGIYLLVAIVLIYLGLKEKPKVERVLIIGGLVLILLVLGGIIFWGDDKEIVPFVPLINENDIQLGNKSSDFVLIEFTDFSCPVCGAASGKNEQYVQMIKSRDASWEPPIPKLIENYVKTGKINYVIKYFPGHGNGANAQLVGWCLYEQDESKYLEYHDAVFENQDKVQDMDFLFGVIDEIGGNRNEVETCFNSGKFNSKLNEDLQYGLSEGVQGTPTYFVGNEKIEGPLSYSEFAKIIEKQI